MPEINNPIPPPGSLPNDYQEVLHWRVTDKPIRVIGLNILAVVFFVILAMIFFRFAGGQAKLPSDGVFTFGLGETSLVFAGILLTMVLHELVHGWVMQMYGAKPSYGVLWKQMMFYATSPGYAFRRNNYTGVALAPLVFISMLSVLGMGLLPGTFWFVFSGVCGIVNASGAVGDLWITAIVLRYPPTAYVMDERDGMRVFLPKG